MTTTSRQTQQPRRRPQKKISKVFEQVFLNAANRIREAVHDEMSVKSLHELRIACRRAEAALRLCEEIADCEAWHWMTRQLKSLRHACNNARDGDVLSKWLQRRLGAAGKPLRRTLRDHRAEVLPEITKIARRVSKDHAFERRASRVLKQLRASEQAGKIAQASGVRLFVEVSRFVSSLPANCDEASALHRLRIVGKRLRYASELVTEIWPDVDLDELNEHLHALQDRLGAIHDHTVGANYLRKRLPRRLAQTARPLVQEALQTAARLQRKFWRWWQACPIERMLADTTAEILTLIRKRS